MSTQADSTAKARAKEAKAKDNVTTAEQPGTSQENARTQAKARAKAKYFKENATSAEKWANRPASAPRTREAQKEPEAKEDTKEPGAKEDSKEKAVESGK